MDFFNRALKQGFIFQFKRLRDKFKSLNRVLTHEKTKLPLGAKLTQNDFKCKLKMDFDIELK